MKAVDTTTGMKEEDFEEDSQSCAESEKRDVLSELNPLKVETSLRSK